MLSQDRNERIAIFIDGDNLYGSLSLLGWHIDFRRLRELLTADCRVFDCFYYTSWDEDERKKKFAIFLINNGFTVRKREQQRIHKAGKLVAIKANTDIMMVLDMVTMKKNYDICVMVTGDGDFCPVVDYLRQNGKRVVAVSSKFDTACIDLVNAVDKFIDLPSIRKLVERIPSQIKEGSDEEEA